MTHISEKKAKELGLIPDKKKSKYNARKTVVDGITFDSKKESEYYCELKLRVQAGEIESFDLQPAFILQEGFKCNGKSIRPITYKGDFQINHKDGSIEIVDTKGFRTEVYKIKKKLFLRRYPQYKFTEV